jgi:hypothetical protein
MEFAFEFDPRFRFLLRPFGIRPERSGVTVDDETFTARFGRWTLSTPLGNVAGTRITEHYKAIKAIGIRGSMVDRGITFGSNARRGVCVCFHEPVGGVFPRVRHPAITVTVADPEGLVAVLQERIGSGDGDG